MKRCATRVSLSVYTYRITTHHTGRQARHNSYQRYACQYKAGSRKHLSDDVDIDGMLKKLQWHQETSHANFISPQKKKKKEKKTCVFIALIFASRCINMNPNNWRLLFPKAGNIAYLKSVCRRFHCIGKGSRSLKSSYSF